MSEKEREQLKKEREHEEHELKGRRKIDNKIGTILTIQKNQCRHHPSNL